MYPPAPGAPAQHRPPEHTQRSALGDRGALAALVLAMAGVVATGLVGRELVERGYRLHLLGGYLLRGAFRPEVSWWVLAPLAVAGLIIGSQGWWRTARWPAVLVASWGAAIAWAVTLAGAREGLSLAILGWPLTSRHEYLHDVARVGGLRELLSGYVQQVSAQDAHPWTTHVGGHPPGPLAFFAALDAIGLGGPVWAGIACILVGAATVPAVLVTVSSIAGSDQARQLAPFLVLAPWALWVATSADALWAGSLAWALAALSRAGRSRQIALIAGLLAGLSAMGSYGIAPLGLLGLAIVAHQRTWRRLGWVAAGALAPLAIAGLFGFWWWEGLHATGLRVVDGPAWRDRPYLYFAVAGLAVAVLAIGPAATAGLRGVAVSRAGRVLVLPVLAALLISDLSGLTKGEVERIWLPFYPWLSVAVLALAPRRAGWWLPATAAWGLVLQLCIRTEW